MDATLVVESWRDSIERVVALTGETSIGGPGDDIDVVDRGPVAIVAPRDGSWWVRPRGPYVVLDEVSLTAETELQHGSLIEIGEEHPGVRLRFLLGDRARVLDDERHLRTVIDPLTKLLNRRGLMGHLARVRPPAALLLIDIDWLKRINDVWGHLVGDTTLRVTTRRIRELVAWPASVGRLGGEEFVVVMSGDRAAALAKAEAIRAACEPPFPFEGSQLVATVSIGVAELGGDPLVALRDADEALIRAKTAGRNRVFSKS